MSDLQIDLTAERYESWKVHGIIVVDGDTCPNASSCLAAVNWQCAYGGPDPECECEATQSISRPPAEWVKATEPCPTCGGWQLCEHGRVEHGPGVSCGKEIDCPDCIDGRPVVTITVPCCNNQAKCNDTTRPHCGWRDDMTADGRVPVATCTTTEIIKIRSASTTTTPDDYQDGRIYYDDPGGIVWQEGVTPEGDDIDLTAWGDDLVGRYALVTDNRKDLP